MEGTVSVTSQGWKGPRFVQKDKMAVWPKEGNKKTMGLQVKTGEVGVQQTTQGFAGHSWKSPGPSPSIDGSPRKGLDKK